MLRDFVISLFQPRLRTFAFVYVFDDSQNHSLIQKYRPYRRNPVEAKALLYAVYDLEWGVVLALGSHSTNCMAIVVAENFQP